MRSPISFSWVCSMSDVAGPALRAVVDELSQEFGAYLCAGADREAMVWSSDTEITVRLSARGDDEIWVIAGSGLLVRFVAASDGDMGDVAEVVRRIVAGEAVEMFGDRRRADDGFAVATGYALGPDRAFAGGLDGDQARWTARIGGPFAAP